MTDLIPLPDEPQLPAHLSSLTDMQAAFVQQYVENGGNGSAAARAAGYAKSSAGRLAWELTRNPRVMKAIQTEALNQLGRHLPMAVHQTAKLARSSKSDYVKLEASRDIMDRCGLKASEPQDQRGNITFQINL